MNWKQFLKPDWRKIVTFVLIIIFSNFVFYLLFCSFIGRPAVYFCKPPILSLPNYFESGCSDTLINNNPVNRHNFISWLCDKPVSPAYQESIPITQYTYFENCGNCNSILGNFYLPLNLMYQYFLSCLIIWLYDKFK